MPKFLDVPQWYNASGELTSAVIYSHLFSFLFNNSIEFTYYNYNISTGSVDTRPTGILHSVALAIMIYSFDSKQYNLNTIMQHLPANSTMPCTVWNLSNDCVNNVGTPIGVGYIVGISSSGGSARNVSARIAALAYNDDHICFSAPASGSGLGQPTSCIDVVTRIS